MTSLSVLGSGIDLLLLNEALFENRLAVGVYKMSLYGVYITYRL